MNIVVDTSVLIAVVANEPERSALIRQTKDDKLFAPASLPWEVGNAFSAMFKRRRISVDQARVSIAAFEKIEVSLVEVDLPRAVALAGQQGIYAYDAYVIIAALDLNCPLLTLDVGLARVAKDAGVNVLEVQKHNANIS